ncbi:hypothetical protein [Niabella drilacis]|uniref:Lipocalin-like domain-containing protein n=1 Tax=Niabella drilacis (strain DSM 25811 / CCM 8410 / CCUG 62505 / LMG 26954 / E90) TaxID=1285928 RepID=A0A1G6JWA8_NIADE|nr:hypothetical protein [Niabella drilacis]SDC22286.1 hypothetical protein SAMN04487894_101642 [Niabella drilacis]
MSIVKHRFSLPQGMIPFLFLCITAGCSKDFFKPYSERIIGRWELYDTNKIGLGSSRIVYSEGSFQFSSDGSFFYTRRSGAQYAGTWRLKKYTVTVTNSEGQQSSEQKHSLLLSATNIEDQQVLAENFDDLNFTGTDRFKAEVSNNFNTVTYKFKRN